MKDLILYFAIVFFGILIGNYLGDMLTMIDCSTAHEAKLMGGGKITCTAIERGEK